jgi:membrane-bound lytic murein transglycosylase B
MICLMTNINIEAVINDLAEQVKKLTVDNAVLRAALSQMQEQAAQAATMPEPSLPEPQEDLSQIP